MPDRKRTYSKPYCRKETSVRPDLCEHNSTSFANGNLLLPQYHLLPHYDTLFTTWKKNQESAVTVTDFTEPSWLDPVAESVSPREIARTKSHDYTPLSAPLFLALRTHARGFLVEPRCLTYPSAAVLAPRIRAMVNERSKQTDEKERKEKRGIGRKKRRAENGKERCRNAT